MPIRRLLSYSDKLPPRSARAFVFAAVIIALAAGVRELFSLFGATVLFAPFYPAILIIALFAGPWAGAFGTALAILIAWWAFMLPLFQFNQLGIAEYANFALFLLSVLLVLWLAHLYRQQIADLRKSEMDRELLLKEMHHRVRNSFAVVQSIVRATLADQPDRAEKIIGRVHAVSRTNDIIDQSDRHQASLRMLVLNELDGYQTKGRIHLVGPDLQLSSDVARHVALVLHEMTTNAVKHGSLKEQDGCVDVSWVSGGDHCILSWQERGGPNIMAPDTRGFGTRMMTRSLEAIEGGIVHEFAPTGLRSRISFRLQ